MTVLAQQVLLGLLLGGLYGLAAAGLSLVFGVLKVLNVAHGELIMLGGYGAFWLFALLGWDPFAALLLVIPGSLLLGAALYVVLFGFVVRAHEEIRIKNSLLVGFGLALALHALAVRLWTADDRSVTTAYSGAVLHVGPLAVPVIRLVSLAIAFALIAGLHLLLARWRWGKAIRATAEDWQAASLTGIDVRRAYLLAFAIGTALAVRLWTADDRSITTPYSGAVLTVGELSIPIIRLVSLAIAFALIAALHLLLARWRWGKAIRATAEDWQAALLTGIDVRRAYLLAFAMGTALAGAAGTLVSVGYSISPSMGLEWTLKALIVVVLAGLGSMLGTFVAGLFVGVAEALSAAAFGGPYREVVGLVIFVVVLVLRPQGLFGRPR